MKKHLDRWLPTIVLVAIAVAVTYSVTAAQLGARYQTSLDRVFREAQPFEAKFAGQSKSSEFDEEWLIRDFFGEKRAGVFLDVGAHHYQRGSNTYYLETVLGWSGLAIEPQTQFAADWQTHRPRTRFVAMFASDVADQTVPLFIPPNAPGVASASNAFASQWGATQPTNVPTTTLDQALQQAGLDRVDFVSMDIELHEPQALAGFDIARYRPALVCIEAHAEVRQRILDYFQARDYVVVGKYLRADFVNLYFMPAQ